MSEQGSHADWRGVGEAFRELGVQLRDHAVEAGGALKDAAGPTGKVLDEVGEALKAALAKFDGAVTDPAVGQATKEAASRLLDAIKDEVNRPRGSSAPPPPKYPSGE